MKTTIKVALVYACIIMTCYTCKSQLPEEFANKKWYKTELFSGEQKIPSNEFYPRLVTTSNEIKYYASESSEPIIYEVTGVRHSGDEVIIDFFNKHQPNRYFCYKLTPTDDGKGYHWAFGIEDDPYISFYAIEECEIDSSSFFLNTAFPSEFTETNFYKVEYIDPYYYIIGKDPEVKLHTKSFSYKGNDFDVDYIDVTNNRLNLTIDNNSTSYGCQDQFIRSRFSITSYDEKKGLYKVDFQYKMNPLELSFHDTHMFVNSHLLSPALNDKYETKVPWLRILPPIYTQPAIQFSHQSPSRSYYARKIQNIKSYIAYKYPHYDEVSRCEIDIDDKTGEYMMVLLKEHESEYTPVYKLLYFKKNLSEQDSHIVLAEAIINVFNKEEEGEEVDEVEEEVGEISIASENRLFYIRYTSASQEIEHCWRPAPSWEREREMGTLAYYESTNTNTKIIPGTLIERIHTIDFERQNGLK